MTSEDQILSVEKQYQSCMKGEDNIIVCPYCGEINYAERQALCCETFAKAIFAVMHRHFITLHAEEQDRILEKISIN